MCILCRTYRQQSLMNTIFTFIEARLNAVDDDVEEICNRPDCEIAGHIEVVEALIGRAPLIVGQSTDNAWLVKWKG